MDEPRSELQADAEERTNSPDFDALTSPEELVRGERTRDDFFDAVLGLNSDRQRSCRPRRPRRRRRERVP